MTGVQTCALPISAQIGAAQQIVARQLSVREAESLARKLGGLAAASPVAKAPAPKSRDIRRIEEALSDLLTAEVEVRIKKRVKRHGQIEPVGELAIRFASLEELNGLIERLRGETD